MNVEHKPRWPFDCTRCKFSWCCGPTCACGVAQELPLTSTPKNRLQEVVRLRRNAGLGPAAVQLTEDYKAGRIGRLA
jgi:hypothetical protein